ncbi:MAG: rod shape-determining protein MreC [Bacteroidales bacterium]|jgi:rod shape-determining protein MreC|nr:rod shape-determining protein MreC [Bacteroidales bacterium]
MDSLFRFLRRIHLLLIFIALEVLSFFMLVNGDGRRSAVFHTSANYIVGNIYDITWKYVGYFNLREENTMLMQQLSNIKVNSNEFLALDTARFRDHSDSAGRIAYRIITASVIKNSTSRRNNFITLDVGSDRGIKPDMGVMSAAGAVGVVVAVSQHYALAISLLNNKTGISAKLKTTNFYGSMIWPGDDYRYATLNEIPNHVPIKQGDTVVTSGYSAIFPPGIPIATIEDFARNSDDNFYSIKVKLLTDFKCLTNVFVIENINQQERKELEAEESKFEQ